MPAASYPGVISINECYSVEALAAIFDMPNDWVINAFITPRDATTRARLRDDRGHLVPGVRHFRYGRRRVIPGQALIAWLQEHGDTIDTGNEEG